MNRFYCVGRVRGEVTTGFTKKKIKRAKFLVEVPRKKKGTQQSDTFICCCFDEKAEQAEQEISEGVLVSIVGRLWSATNASYQEVVVEGIDILD